MVKEPTNSQLPVPMRVILAAFYSAESGSQNAFYRWNYWDPDTLGRSLLDTAHPV